MKKTLLFLALILTLTASSFAYNNLQVVNVRQSWWGYPGTIEKAVLAIHPKGSYMEHGLYLTFSDRGSGFRGNDSLEIQFQFELPKDAYLTDLWLWVEDSLMRALILDRWTATDIYEGIVKRRRDPALLRQDQYSNYIQCDLRVFPLMPGKTRQIKLTFLTPTNWTNSSVQCPFPLSWLKTSKYKVTPFYIIFWPEDTWYNPAIPQAEQVTFKEATDAWGKPYFWAEIGDISQLASLDIRCDNPMKDGIYLTTFRSADDNFYQLGLMPRMLAPFKTDVKKTLFLIDFLPSAAPSGLSGDVLLNNFKLLLKEEYDSHDLFNFVFSKFQNELLSKDWFPAADQTIDSLFNQLNSTYFTQYSNLLSLFAIGIDFIQQHDNEGDIILVSNSTSLGQQDQANSVIKDILKAMEPQRIPIYVIDLNTNSYPYYWIEDRKYIGNEYLYYNISRFTGGEYLSIRQQSLYQMLYDVSAALGGFFSSFDIYTRMSDGYTHSRFDLFRGLGRINLNKPVFQIGKFNGNFPFHIELSGEYEGETVFSQIDVAETDVFKLDSTTQTIWVGKRIEQLRSEILTNSVISEIIDLSLENRIMTDYTALLALEPSDTVKASNLLLYDESKLVAVEAAEEDTVKTEFEIQAFPNPFNTSTTLQLNIPQSTKASSVKLAIYNIAGQLVKTIELPIEANKKSYTFQWNATNEQNIPVASGIYIATIKMDRIQKSIRLVYMR